MKTALDWFANELQEHLLAYEIKIEFSKTDAFKLAKQMEKEQIIDAYANGMDFSSDEDLKEAQEYYNQTYKCE